MTTESSNRRTDEQVPPTQRVYLETVEDISSFVQELFAEIPDEEWDQVEPGLVKWLNEKAGIDPEHAAQ